MTDEAKALVGKLRERAAKVREWIISSQRVVDLLAPEREKFDKREAPWDTYTVRMSVDHQSSIRTQTKEVEEYEQAADLIETQAREIEQLRERVERMGRDKETLLTFARAIQTWRSDADSYDEECDHPQRDYCEDVELMEKAAGYALRRIAERAALAGEK